MFDATQKVSSSFKPIVTSRQTLDKDAFLQLLTTQLQNQDPLNPSSQDQMMTTLSQMGTVEQLTNMNTSISQLLQTGQLNLLGLNVDGKDVDGAVVSGIVSRIENNEGSLVLIVGGKKLPFGNVTNITMPS